jgi:hypothetical protein
MRNSVQIGKKKSEMLSEHLMPEREKYCIRSKSYHIRLLIQTEPKKNSGITIYSLVE